MRIPSFSARVFLPVLIISACLAVLVPRVAFPETVDRIVAVVNDSIITLSELNAATAVAVDRLGTDKDDDKKVSELKDKILKGLVEQKLVKQASDKAGIGVSEREIDNAIEDVKKQNNSMTHQELLYALAQSGLTYREYRDQLREQIRQVKFVNMEFRSKISIQDEDIRNYYNRHTDEFIGPATYRISVIFLSSIDPDKLARKLALVEEELKGGADFKAVASQYSDAPGAAASGGDLGYLKSGEMNPAIDHAVHDLKAGETSGPVTTPEGTYIIKLVDTRGSKPRPIEDVRARIHDQLFKEIMDKRFEFWLEEQKRFAHIEIRM